ncbi:MAG: response regulator [Gammaproteobacteria bacterium]|nr:response regulator [Gammaproteobacteria bacterium]
MAKILVVDDESAVRNLFKEMFQESNHEFFEAENGVEAGDVIDKNDIDLLVTDLVMPDKSGLELIMDIVENNPDLPIIAISGGGGITGRFDYLPIAQLIGAKRIINKPFKIDEVRGIVNELLA